MPLDSFMALSDGFSDELPVEGTDFNDACSSTFCCTSSCPSAISLIFGAGAGDDVS